MIGNHETSTSVILFTVLQLLSAQALGGVPDIGPCGQPPPPKPAHASAAEGLPPLPLPVVPQRRTEKKNSPRPPVIAVKIKTASLYDWATDPNDLNNLLIWMKSKLGVNFTFDQKILEQVNLEAGNVPVLYRTGHNAFSFTPTQRRRLRQYLLRGGMIIFDACCGRQPFSDSARREISLMLPEYKLKPIGMDHPIFNSFYSNAGHVRFTPSSLTQDATLVSPGPSGIEGIEIRCTMAVVFSPHDLSCGWDMHTHTREGSTYIQSEYALKIGANLIAYATATKNMSDGLAQSRSYVDAAPTRTDKFRIGQLVHEGDWNPDPVGLRNLLDSIASNTALQISFATKPVQATSDSLSGFPFIYMTGHDDFTWTDAQVSAIRQYLRNGGFIFGEACGGRQKFDHAFRREMAKVLTGTNRLQPLADNHPLYHIHHRIERLRYSQGARFRFGNRTSDKPRLETAIIDGRNAVIYSPIGLNIGWRLKPVAYAVNYEPQDALRLGENIVLYAISQ